MEVGGRFGPVGGVPRSCCGDPARGPGSEAPLWGVEDLLMTCRVLG